MLIFLTRQFSWMDFEEMFNSTDNLTWTRIEVFSRVRFYCSVLPGGGGSHTRYQVLSSGRTLVAAVSLPPQQPEKSLQGLF